MSTPNPAGEIRHPGVADYGLLFGLALVWGSSFTAIKIAVDDGMPPMSVATLRIAIGAAMLVAIAAFRRQAWPAFSRANAGLWLRILFLGVVGNSLPFFLISWGEARTTSALAGILMAIIPLLVVIFAHFFTRDERLTVKKLIGVGLGFSGIVVLVGGDALRGHDNAVIGQLSIIAGAFCHSLYGVTARRLPKLPSEMLVGVILVAGLVPLLPVWLVHDRPWAFAWHGQGVAAVVWLGLLSTGGGNLLFYVILRRVGAGLASFNNYLVPLMALVWAYFTLGERPHWNAFAALVLILTGLALPRLSGLRRRPYPTRSRG